MRPGQLAERVVARGALCVAAGRDERVIGDRAQIDDFRSFPVHVHLHEGHQPGGLVFPLLRNTSRNAGRYDRTGPVSELSTLPLTDWCGLAPLVRAVLVRVFVGICRCATLGCVDQMSEQTTSSLRAPALGLLPKLQLLARVWYEFALVHIALRRRRPLHSLVQADVRRLSGPAVHPPWRLRRAVDRGLRVGRWRPRCLVRSLVLYRLLQAQGMSPELVIGLPERPTNHKAHAWVELEASDVGPSPGRLGHREMIRYHGTSRR